MRAYVTTAGRRYRVRVDAAGPEFTVQVDGETFQGRIDREKSEVQIGDRTILFRVDAADLEVAGRPRDLAWEPDLDPEQERHATAAGAHSVRPPMAGRVVAVFVAVGDPVQKGQRLLVLEAMKMQNEVPARVSGTITAVRVKSGDSVATTDVLMVIS